MKPGTSGFIGERLREAREARGLTVTSLSEILSISKQAISQYENGKQTPRPEIMDKISDVLNLPKHFFVRQFSEMPMNTIFFRSLSAATKAARTRAIRKFHWLKEIVAYLREYILFKEVNLPQFDIDDPLQLSTEDLERLAIQCRRYWGMGDNPISNVLLLLENNGSIVARGMLEAKTLDAFSEWSITDGAPYIFLGADKESPVRSRFDAAHELAHLILHRTIKTTRFSNSSEHKILENQANKFASSFLLPADTFAADVTVPTLDVFRLLKEKWKASIAMMIERCHQLNLIDDYNRVKLWKGYHYRKWGRSEPLDDTLPVETPKFLARSVALILQNASSKEDIFSSLPYSITDIEELTGLPRGYFNSDQNVVELIPKKKEMSSSVGKETRGKVIQFRRNE